MPLIAPPSDSGAIAQQVEDDAVAAAAADATARVAVEATARDVAINNAIVAAMASLGTASLAAASDFDPVGAAAAAQAVAIQRANHTGTQSADTVVDGTTNKAYTATEKTKLSGVAAGATANSSDAILEARANHTGTQAISTITSLQSTLDAVPVHEYGTLVNLPANGTRSNGSTYFATDQNGGTLYQMVAGVQTQATVGVSAATGLVAGPVFLTTSFNIVTVGATLTDVPGMSIAIPASSKPVCVEFVCEVNGNGSGAAASAAANTKLSAYLILTDNANVNKALAAASFISTGVNGAANEFRQVHIRFWLDAPVAAATYKLRAQSSAAIPSNWAILSLVPSTGQVSGARAGLTATAY